MFINKVTQRNTSREATRDFSMVFFTNWNWMKWLRGTLMLVFENCLKSHKCSICSGRTLFLNPLVSQSSLKWKILFSDDCVENISFFPLNKKSMLCFETVSGGNSSCQSTGIWLVQQHGIYWACFFFIYFGNVERELSSEKVFFSNNENLHGKT